MLRWELYAGAALLALAVGGLAGWQARGVIAESALNKVTAANLAEADRQADIHVQTEKFLRDQLDRANAANSGVHLGSVRCSVSLRDPSGDLSQGGPAAGGPDGPATADNAAARVGRDIGPDLERWARKLTLERERLRGLQYFNAEQAEPVK